MNIFKLLGEIAINNQGAIHAINDTNSRAHALGENMGKVFTAVGNGAIKAGKVIGTGLATGATAMTGLVVKGMNLLSGLEQNLGGSEAVFGEFAKRMQDTAAQAYSSMGLSQSAYLATANKMGSLFKGAGFATVEAVELTEETMQRAADVASIMGIDIEHAMESIAGAAKGNFTMMDNLGVAINDTNLKEYALSKGIRKTTQEMTTQEKVALAMQMFMEKTAYAAGNYAKENDTLAGALTTAKAAFQNFLAGAGSEDDVASALENAATVIGKKLNVLLPKLSQGVGGLIKKLSPRLPGLMRDMLPGIIDGATSMFTGLASALPGLLSAVGEVLPGAISRIWEGIRETAPVLLSALKGVIESVDFTVVGTAIGDGIKYVIENIPAIITDIGNALSYGWEFVLYPIIKGFLISFGIELPEWGQLKAQISHGWRTKVWPAIQDLFETLFDIKLPDWKEIVKKVQTWWYTEILPNLDLLVGFRITPAASVIGAGIGQKGVGAGIPDQPNGLGGATAGGASYEKDDVTGAGGSRSSKTNSARPTLDYFTFAMHENSITRSGDYLSQAIAQMNGTSENNAGQIISLLSAILTATNRPIVLDTGALVSGISSQINTQLGRQYTQSAFRRW